MALARRTFLKASGASFASFALPLPRGHLARAFAREGERRPTLVVLFLRGGADALNVVVPYADERYRELRPTLALPAESVLRLDDEFGLHPSLARLMPLWEAKRLAPIVNVGSPHPTRSHFEAQDFMEYAAPGVRTLRNGWLNRYLALGTAARKPEEGAAKPPEALRVVAMQGLLPRALRGEYPVLAVPERSVLGDERLDELFGPLYDEGSMEATADEEGAVLAAGRDTLAALARFRTLVGDGRPGDEGGYPRSLLGAALRDLARVIRADVGLEVAAIDLIGWDTHAAQGGSEGTMASLLRNLGDSLAAFTSDLGSHAESTLVLAVSEFGRTCRENGNYGTDHGHGGLMLLLGGGVAGGHVHGRWTGLAETNLYEGRDLQVTTDFRDVFAEVLRSHFRFEPPPDFFPGYKPGRVKGLFG